MGLPDLYPAQVGSPYTTLSAPYTSGESTMTLVDATKLPDAPNIVCLTGDVAGEFKYTGKDGNTLTGVTKLSGTPETTWPAGTYAFRGVSAYDHASIVEHLTYQRSHIVEASLDLTTNHSYSGRVLEGAEAGENLTFGDLAVLAESGKFVRANPATLATLDGTIALVVSDTIAAGSQGMFLLRGLIRNDSWTFSPGKELYASNGTLTHEPPTTGTQIIRKVGTALTATIIEFNPSSTLHAEYLVSVLPVNTVSKDNGDVERKFWKDDFSVDSSSQYTDGHYTGDVARFTWDTENKEVNLVAGASYAYNGIISNHTHNLGGGVKISFSLKNNNTSSVYQGGIIIGTANGTSYRCTIGRSGTTSIVYVMAGTSILASDFGQRSNYNVIDGEYHRYELTISSDGFARCTIDGIRTAGGYRLPTSIQINPGPYGGAALNSTVYWKDFSVAPSESYADDFATDTTERYQPVLGTVAYDDANKRMNVTTVAGVNGKASGRLKSYKFCEGSQIYDVLLPTGADGDFICMVTHATDPAMTNGIGVGLQSDGAGNWNLATLSGTKVTVGAPSGLTDGKTARIEIEKDITGAYWYYIYDASGTKPTTATGKLFTALSEGYTGWYANGNSKTYAIDNISIRAESIVGRTNIEVTEPFWFRDEFNENSLGRYPTLWYKYYSIRPTVSDGKMSLYYSMSQGIRLQVCNYKIIDGYISCKLSRPSATSNVGLAIYSTGDVSSGDDYRPSGQDIFFGFYHDVPSRYTIFGTKVSRQSGTIPDYTEGDEVEFKIEIDDYIYKFYVNGTLVYTTPEQIFDIGNRLVLSFGRYWGGTFTVDDLQISGTRIYNKPIHRGAMLETYHDGTQEVVGTTFIDDCQWDRNAEYVTVSGTFTRNVTTGEIHVAAVGTGTIGGLKPKLDRFGDGYIELETTVNTDCTVLVVFCWDGVVGASGRYNNGYAVTLSGSSISKTLSIQKRVNDELMNLANGSISFTETNPHRITVVKSGSTITASVYTIDGTLIKTITTTDNTYTEGYCGIFNWGAGSKYHRYQIIAASCDATNGIAACIPPIGGGARYGVEESVYIPITPGTEIPVGTAVISPNAKSTVVGTTLTTFAQTPAGVSTSLEYATGTKTCPGLSTAYAPTGRHRVKADRNTLMNIGVKGSVAGTSPTVYIDSLHVRKQEVVA